MKYDPRRHHRRSIRLKGYDYAQPGAYFVTICTHQRECLFGEIVGADGIRPEMRLNELGEIVRDEWLKTPALRPNVELGAWVVMPNHIHGIVIIARRGVLQYAPTGDAPTDTIKFKSPSQTIGAIVRGFKSAATKQINAQRGARGIPVWQRNYYEHIIRSAPDMHRIAAYIQNNPAQWHDDDLYFAE